MKTRGKKVMILVSTVDSFGENLVRGVIDYSRVHGPWSLSTDLPDYLEKSGSNHIKRIKDTGADGAIAYIPSQQKAEMVSFEGIPAVIAHKTTEQDVLNLPYIVTDNYAIGRLAADYFQNKGYNNLAFCGFETLSWSQDRAQGFTDTNSQAGLETKIFSPPNPDYYFNSLKGMPHIIKWLKSLPKPIGILTCNDDWGLLIIRACNQANLKVPDEIAVLGVDNNDLACSLTTPTLSSISYSSRKAGYQAAHTLDLMMKGQKPDQNMIVIPPIEVINRQSTDTFAIEDEDVKEAIRFIRTNVRNNIQVDDVANAVNMSRRNLYRKFTKQLGHSVHDEIQRVSVNEISRMLLETDLPISKIALSLGFTSMDHIARYFKKQKGISPQEYRKKHDNWIERH